MNRFAGYAREVPTGHWAMLRFPRDSHPKPIMGEGGKPVIYPTKLEAVEAVLKHMMDYHNGNYRREGERALTSKSEAEKIFGGIFKNGRKIEIERKAVRP